MEGKLAAAEVSVEESRVELAAREEELSREVKVGGRGKAVLGSSCCIGERRGGGGLGEAIGGSEREGRVFDLKTGRERRYAG